MCPPKRGRLGLRRRCEREFKLRSAIRELLRPHLRNGTRRHGTSPGRTWVPNFKVARYLFIIVLRRPPATIRRGSPENHVLLVHPTTRLPRRSLITAHGFPP